MRNILCVLCLFIAATSCWATKWHHPLYLGNGEYWHKRIRIDIRNRMERKAMGEPVKLQIGEDINETHIVSVRADAVRVCDVKGTEMLFRITGPDGQMIRKGPIPDESTITIPVECPAKDNAIYYLYFDNPEAWNVPDFLESHIGVVNGGVEKGEGNAPFGWKHDTGDEKHRALWVTENQHSGNRCLKTIVAEDAEPTWIATRQKNIHIIGGARYVMEAWVKAENVDGYAGWYIHVGNEDNYMMVAPMLKAGEGSYGWKKVRAEFTAPKKANRADLGTVLRGTGTAWFDDVSLEFKDSSMLSATAAKPETLRLKEIGADAQWYDDAPEDDIHWDYRVPVKVMNFSDQVLNSSLVHVDISTLLAQLDSQLNKDSIRVTYQAESVPHYLLNGTLLFEGTVPARTVCNYYVYFSTNERVQSTTSSYTELLKDERTDETVPEVSATSATETGTGNLVDNPSFEQGEKLPDNWSNGTAGKPPEGTTKKLDSTGLFGKQCVKVHIPHSAEKAWTGWRQDVQVEPDRKYFYGAWVKCKDIEDGSVKLHAHYLNADGELCKNKQYTSIGSEISGTTNWTFMSGVFDMPQDIATFQLHLTMLATGTVWHDGVVLAEIVNGTTGKPQMRREKSAPSLAMWQVNAIVKVFQDDLPPQANEGAAHPARILAARNEKEPLQIAIRSSQNFGQVSIKIEPPANAKGDKLTDFEIGVVDYVPIDHKTNYYRSDSPSWHRKYPKSAGACDGWAGMWPDPILPHDYFNLTDNTTQPVWVTVDIPKEAASGDYVGKVKLVRNDKVLKKMPFTVHVWDFTLPDENHVGAIYDLRLGKLWRNSGKKRRELREQFWQFMAEHRVCSNRIYPEPKIKYENGEVVADFTEYDKAAEYYFNKLKLPYTYTPRCFYLFGWGHPPKNFFGEGPYEGDYPYEDIDRSKLRTEFKRAYQKCLKVYWEHMKEKGWDDKCVLYISDEPWYNQERIKTQMKALCDMIHEVDSDIPIYSSTWHYRPEWDGYLDVWGIGHYGVVAPEKMKELRKAGDLLWFTTDGQMCTDTPYCGVERLLPHYCFKYNVQAYEFWGVSWLTYNPYKFGWHAYIHQSGEPGESKWVRYPNGDGFLAYPGDPIGHDGPVSSVRLEQAREGVEDYEYLYMLRELVEKGDSAGKDVSRAKEALRMAKGLVEIPNAGGRYSTRILPNPDAVFELKETVAKEIERLIRSR